MSWDKETPPRYKDMYPAILEVLSDGNTQSIDSIYDGMVKRLELPQNILDIQSSKGGENRVRYDMRWALTNLSNLKLISMPKRGYRAITDEGKDVLSQNVDWDAVEIEEMPETDASSHMDFFEFLEKEKLFFDLTLVEDFLISLKSKQFLIFSGGSGTGKTRLAQAYGKYISGKKDKINKAVTEVTLGKSDESMGYTLNHDEFFKCVPDLYKKLDGPYRFSLDGVECTGNISMSPRLWFKDETTNAELIKYIQKAKKEKNKGLLTLYFDKFDTKVHDQNYSIIPVGSNWTDNRHILGYMNALSGKYVRTPSLDILIKSGEDFTNPYLMILDEMNLSHVERYFSDILSAMESNDPIYLGSKDVDVPESIMISNNLFVIGTVNMDETTYMFSPKVLDRANVLEFEPASISKFLSSESISYDPKGDVDYLQNCMNGLEVRDMDSREIINIISESNEESCNIMIDHLQTLQELMSSMNLPFGYRTVDEFMRFMYVAWNYEGKGGFRNWRRYFDSQVKQKILPKIHGNTSIREGLAGLESFCRDNGYPRSAAKLTRMVEVLDGQRYVSFNC